MGNGSSTLNIYDQSHVSIYKKVLLIQSPKTRVEMIQTLLAGSEYISAARNAGVYSHLLAYVARVNAGERPAPLPGETAFLSAASTQLTVQHEQGTSQARQKNPTEYVATQRKSEKAMNYFQNCLLVLNLEEEVALNEDSLRSAYKKAAVKAHPDKGGSEQQFEAVTRAYGYLTEILRRVQGGRSKEGKVEAPTVLKDSRSEDTKEWQHVQPVKLNPKNLDMNAFNKMFEQTRIPDPDEDGYGDWLKTEGGGKASGQTFSGKFNRDVFNDMFEKEARSSRTGALAVMQPQAMTLAPGHGVELGRGAAGDYTAAANASVKYTDLKQAYTTYNTFSSEVAGVAVDNRTFDGYSASRKKAPEPLTNHEMEAIQAAERAADTRERHRGIRAAQEMNQADEYFKRMKQMVLMDAAPMGESNGKKRQH
jgi:curved DNA-binding protein CbpA